MIKHVLGSDSLTVYVDHKPYTINKQAHNFKLVLDAVKNDDAEALKNALDLRSRIAASLTANGNGNVRLTDNQIFYGDREVTGLIASRIFETIRLGLSAAPMVKFIENLMENPSKRAVDELFGFLEACTLPITDDGHFLAYKRVRADYKDVHSATMDNSKGKTLSMPRNLVDEDKNRTCSAGLHFCSYGYLSSFGGDRIMVLKINPKDVVAIPADYNNSKGRTCRYEVVDELPLDEYNKLPSKPLVNDFTPAYGLHSSESDNAWDSSETEWEQSWESSEDEVDVEAELEYLSINEIDELLESVVEGVDTLDDIADSYGISLDTVLELMRRNKVKYGEQAAPVAQVDTTSNTTGKLTPDNVRAIRKLLKKGNDSLAAIGRQFGVHPRTIGRIRDGEAWNEV